MKSIRRIKYVLNPAGSICALTWGMADVFLGLLTHLCAHS